MKTYLLLMIAAVCMTACNHSVVLTDSGLVHSNFQTEVEGMQTELFILRNAKGMEVAITNFGGRIVSVMVPDKDGVMRDVVLGFDSIQDYIHKPNDFGATVGRYTNRIQAGRFTLDGVEYQLPRNDYGHCLHGGPRGFQYQVYNGKQRNGQTLELTYLSKDEEECFPGNLSCTIVMTLTNDNAIDIRYEAKTDKPTLVNMSNHSYFNLDGDALDSSDHLLKINADTYTPIDSTFMTTGEIATVEGTPMNFRQYTPIGLHVNQSEFDQIRFGRGYDHNWVLNTQGDISQVCASLKSPKTGIVLDVYTSEPGIQVYTANFLNGGIQGKREVVYNEHAAISLQTQKYPDSPNKPHWPSPVLRPGETYQSRCIYKFYVEK